MVVFTIMRVAKFGESHGGLFFFELENEVFKQMVDYHENDIDQGGSAKGFSGNAVMGLI